ncbi:tRNA (adenine(58)-N(1))-methyltransferase, mitochondrial-like isoform X2 [Denticeps clupeoides]|uniref:tRNA (adenine(58)-N(1))-methyltransferase, mitochondrial-like isoform X2 n=1 Tax=Denticeps clupeoides TaxID=299321 RepID=UPI0010A39026|nr:tRNA (adenine(58)-N(1))-methyltransferase, mitochondrial-like isoform X2 [Denticeps clupeoides]
MITMHRHSRVCVNVLWGQMSPCLYSDNLRIPTQTCSLRAFGSDSKGSGNNGSCPDTPDPPATEDGRKIAPLFGRRRPLSPLERVSRLLPEESLSPEIWQLRELKQEEIAERAEEQSPDDRGTQGSSREYGAPLPGERPMCFGEHVLAEYQRRRHEFRKMFQLSEGSSLQSSCGVIPHESIAGCPSGSVLHTSIGLPMLLRRPSLDEFTLYMRRGPAIAYPKDCSAMLMMMDTCEGDCVLESGTGTGAMTLFLSRAVGSKGRVLSVEVREDHHRRAVRNYQRWRASWSLRRGEEWPDNVHFHHADLQTAAPLLSGWGFNSMALDMLNPHLVLPTVIPHLHPGAVCAVYLANVTQIIDLLEGLRCLSLPVACDRIVEVQYRDWLLAPSFRKDGSFNSRRAPVVEDEEQDSMDDDKDIQTSPPFGSVPYIARPHPEQGSHTAFLVKLRKVFSSPSRESPGSGRRLQARREGATVTGVKGAEPSLTPPCAAPAHRRA